jgi:hypothetical protein
MFSISKVYPKQIFIQQREQKRFASMLLIPRRILKTRFIQWMHSRNQFALKDLFQFPLEENKRST